MGIKVLTVEDSVLIRRILNDMIEKMDGIELAGTARNGAAALKMIQEMKPDLITLDVEMPVLDGLQTLERLRKYSSIPVIMLSSRNDEETTLKALEMGAQDFLQKPVNIRESSEEFVSELEAHIKALATSRKPEPAPKQREKKRLPLPKAVDALVIGASTGGPKAILSLVRELPAALSIPVFIVQHMPEGFTASFAKRLDMFSSIPVVEAEDRMRVEPGTAYLAPGGMHMILQGNQLRLLNTGKIHGVKPAVDPLFETIAHKFGRKTAAVLLTGMGHDGTIGCLEIKKQGGYVLAQSEESCVVYGMPRYAKEAGAVDEMLPLEEIISSVKEMVRV